MMVAFEHVDQLCDYLDAITKELREVYDKKRIADTELLDAQVKLNRYREKINRLEYCLDRGITMDELEAEIDAFYQWMTDNDWVEP